MRQSKTPSKLTLAHVLMVLAGLMTFVGVSSVLGDRRETQEVLIATRAGSAGSEASALELVAVEVPVEHPLSPQFTLAGSIVGTERIARDIEPGQPLFSNDLLTSDDRVAVRTFSIPVDDVPLRGLQLRVNDHVDIIGEDSDDNVYFVVADVRVAAVSQIADPSGFASAGNSFVTVEVSDLQALALSRALRQSTVDLVRSTGAQPLDPPVLKQNMAAADGAELGLASSSAGESE